jgi:hypothetical protein
VLLVVDEVVYHPLSVMNDTTNEKPSIRIVVHAALIAPIDKWQVLPVGCV